MRTRILYATFKRNFIIQRRAYPLEFFIGKILSAFYTVLTAYFMYNLLFKGQLNDSFSEFTGTSDYMSYVILGGGIYLFVVGTFLNVSRSLITEMRTGTIDSLMIAPFDRVGYFFGNMLQQTFTTSMEFLLAIIISIPFGINLTGINIPATILAFLISLVAYFGMSLILAAGMLYFRDTYISQNTVFLAILLLCGITYPIEYLPQWVQYISHIIPVTTSLNMIRNSVILGMGIPEQLNNFGYLMILAILYSVIGFKLLKRIEKIALENNLA
ncbi:ABC transporter permease [Clostridium sp. D2Q-11]|uniref:Transport permease protein n=1 Tax=Anaeromonas frigoriresistens TaxID=2683708 RepID=A0A942UYY4_9FIRM|nr:ABC transporter permease [Anaeromonas frigoriresistens]MBS4539374.1 ABC transporter permease [Anaeromonas frigoriresistens]